jgi:hypothetical protein
MSAPRKGLATVVLWLNVLATPLLLFVLAGLWLYRERVFVIGNPLTAVELTMLIGFGSILLIYNLLLGGRLFARRAGAMSNSNS